MTKKQAFVTWQSNFEIRYVNYYPLGLRNKCYYRDKLDPECSEEATEEHFGEEESNMKPASRLSIKNEIVPDSSSTVQGTEGEFMCHVLFGEVRDLREEIDGQQRVDLLHKTV